MLAEKFEPEVAETITSQRWDAFLPLLSRIVKPMD